MERPRDALTERVLAALALAAALGAAAVERGSALASHIRRGEAWPFWLEARRTDRKAPSYHFGVYDPVRRSAALVHVPAASEEAARRKVAALSPRPIDWAAAGRLAVELGPSPDEETSADAARALKRGARSPRAWAAHARAAARGLAQGDRSAADGLLLSLELRRVPVENLEPAVLPGDGEAPAFLSRLFSPRPRSPDEGRAVVAEVLNATDRPGLAARAAKMLRSRGVDVISTGSAPIARERTVIYDRTGDFDRAARVRDALACPTALAVTRVEPLRGVDASVELGRDCAD